MLKPFYNKKKNIDDRLVPAVSAADAGKVLGVTEDGKIAPVEGGDGGGGDVLNVEVGVDGWFINKSGDEMSLICKSGPVVIIIDESATGGAVRTDYIVLDYYDSVEYPEYAYKKIKAISSDTEFIYNSELSRFESLY